MRRAGSQSPDGNLIVLQGSIDGGGTVVIDHRPDSPREPLVYVFDCECKFALIPFKEIPKSKVENPPVHIDCVPIYTTLGCPQLGGGSARKRERAARRRPPATISSDTFIRLHGFSMDFWSLS